MGKDSDSNSNSELLWPVEIGPFDHYTQIVTLVEGMTIKNQDEADQARLHLATLRARQDELLDKIEKAKRPHLNFNRAVDNEAKPWKDLLQRAYNAFEKQILSWDEAVEAENRRLQAEALKQHERAVQRAENNAAKKGAPVPIVEPAPFIPPRPKTVAIGGVKQTTVERKICEMIPVVVEGYVVPLDPETLTYEQCLRYKMGIPAKYFVLDYQKIKGIVTKGGDVPGFRLGTEKSIAQKDGGYGKG